MKSQEVMETARKYEKKTIDSVHRKSHIRRW